MRGVCHALILLAGLALLASSTPAGAQRPRAERPTYTVGEKWIRSDGIYDLIRIEKGLYIFAAGVDRQIHLTKDLALAKAQKGENVLEFDPPPKLTWPLEVGKSGMSWGIFRSSTHTLGEVGRGRTKRGTFTWRVEAYEDVNVVAGAFKAFRISLVIEPPLENLHLGYRQLCTWYAPEARQFVKAEGDDLELLAFQVVALDQLVTAPLQMASEEPNDRAGTTSGEIVEAGKAPPSMPAGGAGPGNPPARCEPPGPPPPPALVSVTAPLPLQVAISSPRDQARVDQESIALAGLVSSGKGVSLVVVTLNGVEVSRLEEQTPQRALAVNLPLQLREGDNTLVITATEVGGTIQQEVRTIHSEKRVPLTVAFRYPEDGSRVTDEVGVVAAVVTSSKGVAKVSMTLNGAEVFQQSERTPQKSVAVTAPVRFREGVNAIVLSANEPDGALRQEIRTVLYDRPKVSEAVPAVPPAVVSDRWAVVVGVGRYESPEIPRLRYSVPDAEAIYQILIGPAGFKKEHVLLLTDKTEKPPTLRNLKWALGTFLARSAKKDDTVVIFFAGHGAPEPDPRGIEGDGLSKYLIPSDADPDDLFSTALPMDDIHTIFGRIESERVVVFLDTCYSGAAGGRTFASKKTRAGRVDDLFLERLTRSKGRAIITASRPAEVSIEVPELGHGIFTYYLIQGLKGAADLNRDGIVSLQELYEYVEQQVTRKSRAVGGNQHPVMKGELEGVLPLVKVGGAMQELTTSP